MMTKLSLSSSLYLPMCARVYIYMYVYMYPDAHAIYTQVAHSFIFSVFFVLSMTDARADRRQLTMSICN